MDGGIGGVTGNLMMFNCSYAIHAVFIGHIHRKVRLILKS